MRLVITQSLEESGRRAADLLEEVLKEHPRALVGCATGGSMESFYRALCRDCREGRVDFSQARAVNLDEYTGLGPRDPQSFAWFLEDRFFSQTNLRRENIHLIDGRREPGEEALRLREFLDREPVELLMLGMGENGHVGFNEPGPVFLARPHVAELTEETIRANARFFPDPSQVPRRAVTMGAGDIARARRAVLIAAGRPKARALRRLLFEDTIDPGLPCSILRACAQATVLVDRDLAGAAGLL